MDYRAAATGDRLCAFRVVGRKDAPVTEANAFLTRLSLNGASPYTLRSYAQGLAHFLDWLQGEDLRVEEVTRTVVGRYVDDFRRGRKAGACRPNPEKVGAVNILTRKPYASVERKQSTVNHRLSVLSSFFAHRTRSAEEKGLTPSANPLAGREDPMEGSHGMVGRDAPRRGRAGNFRRRVPRDLPRALDPELAEALVEAVRSRRDKALLTLLLRTGQRVGDWSDTYGRHGLLGMTLLDLDEVSGTVVVRLKGSRDEHRVPVTEDFWPLWRDYLECERGDPPTEAAWVGLRRGKGRPLSYAAFEASLRYAAGKLGVNAHAHMLRHTLAQAIAEWGDLAAAQEILGHRHLSTTAETYARADARAMARAVAGARDVLDAGRARRESGSEATGTSYAFPYDEATLEELEGLATPWPIALRRRSSGKGRDA